MIAIQSFNNLTSISGGGGAHCHHRSTIIDGANGINFDDNNLNSMMTEYKIDDETLISQPPKYEEIVKEMRKGGGNGNGGAAAGGDELNTINVTASTSNGQQPRTSNSVLASSEIIQLPTYSSLMAKQNSQAIV